jgi:nucleotide-binding universal stress UspA family protein
MKKVLISLDYDPSAQKVAETGFSIAKTMGAEITLLHVAADPMYYAEIDHVTIMGFCSHMESRDEIAQKTIEPKEVSHQFLRKSKLHLGDDCVHTVFKEGDCVESILEAAKDLKADVIIMGSHSRKGLKNRVIGSVTENVLLNATIPVLIIPTHINSHTYF